MLWYTYLFENTVFTNKRDSELFGNGKAWEAGEGKEKVLALIKSLICAGVEKMRLGRTIKYQSK